MALLCKGNHPDSLSVMPRRYVNQAEPSLKGHSVTVKAGAEQIQAMQTSAARTFLPEMAQLLQVGSQCINQLVCAYKEASQGCVALT